MVHPSDCITTSYETQKFIARATAKACSSLASRALDALPKSAVLGQLAMKVSAISTISGSAEVHCALESHFSPNINGSV